MILPRARANVPAARGGRADRRLCGPAPGGPAAQLPDRVLPRAATACSTWPRSARPACRRRWESASTSSAAAPRRGDDRAGPRALDCRRPRAMPAAPWWERAAPRHRDGGCRARAAVSSPLLLGIDEGTTAVKAALFDARRCEPVAEARRRGRGLPPAAGLGGAGPRADPRGGARRGRGGARAAATVARCSAAGLDHQGESVLAWDASTRARPDARDRVAGQAPGGAAGGARRGRARALGTAAATPTSRPASSPGCSPTTRRCARPASRARCDSAPSTRSSPTRLGGRFATDLSTASRTQLLAVGGRDWDEVLLAAFGIEREWLPEIAPTFGELGELTHERWRADAAPVRTAGRPAGRARRVGGGRGRAS